MRANLPVNWWAGNLRPHESTISFIARFCAMNEISPKRCVEFLEEKPTEKGQLSKVNRIATLLREPPEIIRTVFTPRLHRVICANARIPWEFDRTGLRYCEQCARYGYHSGLHEINWLSVCPFHMTELKWIYASDWSSSSLVLRVALLRSLMEGLCPRWPHRARGDGLIFRKGRLATLTRWIDHVSEASSRRNAKEIWRPRPETGYFRTAQIFGQFRSLKAMPKLVMPMITDLGDDSWEVQVREFPQEAKAELHRIEPKFNISWLYEFYKRIRPLSDNPPAFFTHLISRQNELRRWHGSSCQCRWELRQAGWLSQYWEEISPERRPLRTFYCPFQAAINELELGWGHYRNAMLLRQVERETQDLIYLSLRSNALGLTRYTKGAVIPPSGHLLSIFGHWPCCEWVQDCPLTPLFDAMAECELELTYHALTTWLDQINRGMAPTEREDPIHCLQLRETTTSLILVYWKCPTPKGGVIGQEHPRRQVTLDTLIGPSHAAPA